MGEALDVVDHALAAFDAGDENALRDCYAEDAVLEAPGAVRIVGRLEVAEYNIAFMRAFHDVEVTTHLRVEKDDLVVEEYTMTATHSGVLALPHGDVPPTNRRISLRVAEVYQVARGKIAESHLYFDQALLLNQLRREG